MYIPLKTLFLLSEFYMFYWAQHEYQGDRKYDSMRAELELSVGFMLQRGVSISFSGNTDDGIELLWGNCGILLNTSGNLIRDYADYALPRGVDTPEGVKDGSLLDPSFLTFLEAFTQRNTFVSDMFIEGLKDAQV